MTNQQEIAHQQELLATYRARLKILLSKQASFGLHAPAYIQLEIDDARTQIRHIKDILQRWDVHVEDSPGDQEPSDTSPGPTVVTPQFAPGSSPAESQGEPAASRPKRSTKPRRAAGTGTDVFISYNQADKEWVRGTLLPRLEQAGLSVIIDYRDFEFGLPKLVNIEQAVERSRHTLIVITPEWVRDEWNGFQGLLAASANPDGLQRKLIPLLLEPSEVPSRIAFLEPADLRDAAERDAQLDRLAQSLATKPGTGSRARAAKQTQQPDAARSHAAADVEQAPATSSPDLGREKQRAALEQRLAALIEDQVAAIEQQNRAQSAVEVKHLQREVDHLQQEIEQVQRAIRALQ